MRILTFTFLCLAALPAAAGTLLDVPYYPEAARTNAYQAERCVLDARFPDSVKGFPTVVWFHGGGLSGGQKHWIDLKDGGIAVVAVNYRLAPRAQVPDFIRDAAAAVAWTFAHAAQYGGDTNRIFVSGHSAGGYLAAMVGLDPEWLAPYGISPRRLAGIAPISGQMSTHFLVKKQRGDKGEQYRPLIDEYAPLYWVSKDAPPVCLITGDRRVEWPCRVEENELLAASLRRLGAPKVEFYEMGGLDHGGAGEGGLILLRKFVREICDGK
jgi:acetyl esterase/lipase